MKRVRLLRTCEYGTQGSIAVVDNNIAFGLIDAGDAEITKDIRSIDYKVKSDEEQADGKFTKLRTHKRK